MNAASTGNATLDHFRDTRAMHLDLTAPPRPSVFGLATSGDGELSVDPAKPIDVDLTLPGEAELHTPAYQISVVLGVGGNSLQVFSRYIDVGSARTALAAEASAVGFDGAAIDGYLDGLDTNVYTHMAFPAPTHGYLSVDVEIRTYTSGAGVVALYGLTWGAPSP